MFSHFLCSVYSIIGVMPLGYIFNLCSSAVFCYLFVKCIDLHCLIALLWCIINKQTEIMTRNYERTEVISFYDLTEDQQINALDYDDSAEDVSFVLFEGEPLPLNMFMRTDGLFDGIYGMSYFSAYFVKLSSCGSMAVVADRYF